MQVRLLSFYRDETGAIGIDWVFMSAGMVAGGLAMFAAVTDGAKDLVGGVSDTLVQIEPGADPRWMPGGIRPGEEDGAGAFGGSGGRDGLQDLGDAIGSGSGSDGGAAGSIGPDGEGLDGTEIVVTETETVTDVLVVDAALVVDAVIENMIEAALDDAAMAQEILTQREVWASRIGDAAFPQATDVVAALDTILIDRGLTPPA